MGGGGRKGGGYGIQKKYIFFKSGSANCEAEIFTFKTKQDIIGATNCICRSQ